MADLTIKDLLPTRAIITFPRMLKLNFYSFALFGRGLKERLALKPK